MVEKHNVEKILSPSKIGQYKKCKLWIYDQRSLLCPTQRAPSAIADEALQVGHKSERWSYFQRDPFYAVDGATLYCTYNSQLLPISFNLTPTIFNVIIESTLLIPYQDVLIYKMQFLGPSQSTCCIFPQYIWWSVSTLTRSFFYLLSICLTWTNDSVCTH